MPDQTVRCRKVMRNPLLRRKQMVRVCGAVDVFMRVCVCSLHKCMCVLCMPLVAMHTLAHTFYHVFCVSLVCM